jgi:hypothetical protein
MVGAFIFFVCCLEQEHEMQDEYIKSHMTDKEYLLFYKKKNKGDKNEL